MGGAVLAIGTGLIPLTGVQPMQEGSFGVGDLALFMYLLTEVGIGVKFTGEFLNTWKQSQMYLHRVSELQQGLPMALETRRRCRSIRCRIRDFRPFPPEPGRRRLERRGWRSP